MVYLTRNTCMTNKRRSQLQKIEKGWSSLDIKTKPNDGSNHEAPPYPILQPAARCCRRQHHMIIWPTWSEGMGYPGIADCEIGDVTSPCNIDHGTITATKFVLAVEARNHRSLRKKIKKRIAFISTWGELQDAGSMQ